MIFDKHRFEVWTQAQHPYKHTLSDFGYNNEALPGVTEVNSALNWIIKVLYPITKPAVANVAALPALGNTLNDYRVVLDDGDGNNAGYRWEQREGEVSPSWHKVFDFDWSTDSILAALTDVTQDLYVYQKGKSDLDAAGTAITGLYAGQTINGGNLANQNLTLRANSGDGVGAHTGYVQVDDNFRATVHNTYDLGTAAIKFKDGYFQGSLIVNTMTLSTGSIIDSTGTISFGNENLTTTGNINGAVITASSQFVTGTMVISAGSIDDSSGAISFDDNDLSTTGTITAASGSVLADFTFANGSLTSASATINFGTNNLLTTGTLGAGDATVTRLDSDNIRLDGNTVSILNSNGSLNLVANGTGVIDLQSAATTLGITATGVVGITGQLNVDNLRLDANVISSQNLNGNITLSPNGAGYVEPTSHIISNVDAGYDLGATGTRWNDLFLANNIDNGTNAMNVDDLVSLRDINVGVAAGMSLFYDGSKWVASSPDTEITHNTLSGLTTGDAGHTQFVMLAGRAGGQTIQGDTAASGLLILESTANATKGTVQTKDNFVPFTNASYSGGWSGTDLGDASHNFRDIYSKGEFRGFRLENFTSGTLPASSGQNVGRTVWATDNNKIYVDTGTSWIIAGIGKFTSDTSWNGTDTAKTVTVSSTIVDARLAIWALHDNANDFDRIYCSIKAISATQVTITVSPALPAGSYRLIGIE